MVATCLMEKEARKDRKAKLLFLNKGIIPSVYVIITYPPYKPRVYIFVVF